MLQLHEWQTECLHIWARSGYRGIVNAVTGSGKTVLALSAVKHLEIVSGKELRVKIVVPQTFLTGQWKEELKRLLGAKPADIGVYCGSRKDTSRKYMIYVVNSARYCLARHILSDISGGAAVFLIADECHHYGSAENSRIFDFYKAIAEDAPYYALGLSATPEIVNFKTISTPLGREIYSYDLGRALRDKIISRFILFTVTLGFSRDESDEYEELSLSLTKCLAYIRKKRPEIWDLPSALFFAQLQRLARQEGRVAQAASTALTLMYKRRTLSHMALARPLCAAAIVKALPAQARIILFCERIQAAEKLFKVLSEQYPGQAGLYHSKMAGNARKDMLERYKLGVNRLLICCKALDEGLNIPSTDAGIIVSASMSARQRVQRLGRMLRRSKDVKRIYYLYIENSSEERELVLGLNTLENSVPLIALRYRDGAFYHAEYERLRGKALEYMSDHSHSPRLRDALSQNIGRALIRGDFLLSEPACRENLRLAGSVAERNYWTSVLYIILARLDKLN